MDEKVRNITLDQQYNTIYYVITIVPAFTKCTNFNEDFLHFQRPLHLFSGLYLQQMSSQHTAEAYRIVIHLIENPPFSS